MAATVLTIALTGCGGGSGSAPVPIPTTTPTSAPVFTYFALPPGDTAGEMTKGPDGNVWFLGTKIGKITPQGAITEFAIPSPPPNLNPPGAPVYPYPGFVAGPDGRLWFLDAINISVENMSPSEGLAGAMTTTGSTTYYPTPYLPGGIAALTGSLWIPESYFDPNSEYSFFNIAKLSTTGLLSTYDEQDTQSIDNSSTIAAGPDGNLWFGSPCTYQCQYPVAFVKMTPSGVMTQYPVPLPPLTSRFYVSDIVAGPDGNMWFTADAFVVNTWVAYYGKISVTGNVTPYLTTNNMVAITPGPDGNIWFTDANGKIGNIKPNGAITEYSLNVPSKSLQGITLGADDNIWFADGNLIGKIHL